MATAGSILVLRRASARLTVQSGIATTATRRSMVVRIEPQDVLFILSAIEPEIAKRTFAEALAKRTALSALEKDFPTGVEVPLLATQIDRIPPEIENRIPDFYMNGNKAWLVGHGTAGI